MEGDTDLHNLSLSIMLGRSYVKPSFFFFLIDSSVSLYQVDTMWLAVEKKDLVVINTDKVPVLIQLLIYWRT